MSKPRILVMTAAGKTGMPVALQLLSEGFSVTAFVRKEDTRSEFLKSKGADIVVKCSRQRLRSIARRTEMTIINTLIDHNKHFADQHIHQSLSIMPKLKTMIIGCVDPRVDPAVILGLEPGAAIVIRNVGGRVTPSAMQTLGLLSMVSPNITSDSEQPWNLIVLHHTDCGIRRIEHNAPDMLAGFFGIPKEQLDSKAVNDPRAAVMIDVAALKANPVIQRRFVISGIVYDVDSGLVEVVVPPAS